MLSKRLSSQRVLSNPAIAKHAPVKAKVWIAAAISALGGLVFGWDIGGGGGTYIMPSFRETMGWPPLGSSEETWVSAEQGLITAMFSIGALVGALPSGMIIDYFGRKKSLIYVAFEFTIAMVIVGTTAGFEQLCVGRFLGGLGIGAMSMMCTLYQSELAPEQIRGKLVSMQQLAITLGIFIAAILNVPLQYTEWGWRFSYAGNGIFSFFMMIAMFFMPESPRWLMEKNREEEAKEVMTTIRDPSAIDKELENIKIELEECKDVADGRWSDLCTNDLSMSYRMMVGIFIQFFQQWTGINAIMYFAPSIFAMFLSTEGAMWANVGMQAVNFSATFICIALIDKYGRKSLLLSGGALLTLFTALVAIVSSPSFYTAGADPPASDGIAAAIVIFCALYVASFAYSWGPIPWVLCAEIFPNRHRGKAMSLSTTTNWLTNLCVGMISPLLYNPSVLDLYGTFALFCGCCVLMSTWAYFFIPETKGYTLEDMDLLFAKYTKESLPCGIKYTPTDDLTKGDIEMEGDTNTNGKSGEKETLKSADNVEAQV